MISKSIHGLAMLLLFVLSSGTMRWVAGWNGRGGADFGSLRVLDDGTSPCPDDARRATYASDCRTWSGRGARFNAQFPDCSKCGYQHGNTCMLLGLIQRVDNIWTSETNLQSSAADELVKHCPDIFDAIIQSHAKIHGDKNIHPVVDPPHRVPHASKKNNK